MDLADLAVGALGFTTTFASTVWAIVGWAAWRARHWYTMAAHLSLIVVNVFSTVVIVSQLIERPLDLPRGSVTLILLPLIGIPPALQLRAWVLARRLMEARSRTDE
jgi:hypothetical protein